MQPVPACPMAPGAGPPARRLRSRLLAPPGSASPAPGSRSPRLGAHDRAPDCFCFHGNRPMTWFSRAAPRTADPRGEEPPQRGKEAARDVPSTPARGTSPASAGGGTRASVRADALKVRAVPRGRRARERLRVEQGPNWSKQLNMELWRLPQRSESPTTTRSVNKRVETVPNHSAQKPGKRTNGFGAYVRNQRPPTPGLGVNLQPIRVSGPNQ